MQVKYPVRAYCSYFFLIFTDVEFVFVACNRLGWQLEALKKQLVVMTLKLDI